MPFLDDAHRLGLLRAVGPLYQFRHVELQAYLAGVKLDQMAMQLGLTREDIIKWRDG